MNCASASLLKNRNLDRREHWPTFWVISSAVSTVVRSFPEAHKCQPIPGRNSLPEWSRKDGKANCDADGCWPAGPLITTWPCFTEAMYLLGEAGGYRYQERLWQLRNTGRLQLLELTPTETDRMAVLMAQYRNIPMDLADASLVVTAESRGVRRLFTIDGDFYIYRLVDGSVLEVIR